MVTSILPGSATALYVRSIERPAIDIPETIFHLKPGLRGPERLAVLAELRQRFPGAQISALGEELILRRL